MLIVFVTVKNHDLLLSIARGSWYSFSQKRKTAYFKLKDHFVNFYIDNNKYNMNNNNNNYLFNACVAPGIFRVP